MAACTLAPHPKAEKGFPQSCEQKQQFDQLFPKVASVFSDLLMIKPRPEMKFLHLSCTQCSIKILFSTATERSALSFLHVYQIIKLPSRIPGAAMIHSILYFTEILSETWIYQQFPSEASLHKSHSNRN